MSKEAFTIEEIRNYLNTHNTLSEALEFLTPEDIEAAQEEFEDPQFAYDHPDDLREESLDELVGDDEDDLEFDEDNKF